MAVFLYIFGEVRDAAISCWEEEWETISHIVEGSGELHNGFHGEEERLLMYNKSGMILECDTLSDCTGFLITSPTWDH